MRASGAARSTSAINASRSTGQGGSAGRAMAIIAKRRQKVLRSPEESPIPVTRPRHCFAALAQPAKPAGSSVSISERTGLAERRRAPIGRDADHERRTVDDGAELEVAEGGPVDHVDGHARARAAAAKAAPSASSSSAPMATATP